VSLRSELESLGVPLVGLTAHPGDDGSGWAKALDSFGAGLVGQHLSHHHHSSDPSTTVLTPSSFGPSFVRGVHCVIADDPQTNLHARAFAAFAKLQQDKNQRLNQALQVQHEMPCDAAIPPVATEAASVPAVNSHVDDVEGAAAATMGVPLLTLDPSCVLPPTVALRKQCQRSQALVGSNSYGSGSSSGTISGSSSASCGVEGSQKSGGDSTEASVSVAAVPNRMAFVAYRASLLRAGRPVLQQPSRYPAPRPPPPISFFSSSTFVFPTPGTRVVNSNHSVPMVTTAAAPAGSASTNHSVPMVTAAAAPAGSASTTPAFALPDGLLLDAAAQPLPSESLQALLVAPLEALNLVAKGSFAHLRAIESSSRHEGSSSSSSSSSASHGIDWGSDDENDNDEIEKGATVVVKGDGEDNNPRSSAFTVLDWPLLKAWTSAHFPAAVAAAGQGAVLNTTTNSGGDSNYSSSSSSHLNQTESSTARLASTPSSSSSMPTSTHSPTITHLTHLLRQCGGSEKAAQAAVAWVANSNGQGLGWEPVGEGAAALLHWVSFYFLSWMQMLPLFCSFVIVLFFESWST